MILVGKFLIACAAFAASPAASALVPPFESPPSAVASPSRSLLVPLPLEGPASRRHVLSLPGAAVAAAAIAVAPPPSLAAPSARRTASLATGPISGGPLPLTVGLGTCLVTDADTERQVLEAIGEHGYRVIDTAQRYANESGVGRGIRRAIDGGDVRREDVFVTTKVWVSNMGRGRTGISVARSAWALGVDSIDLVLVHWPGLFERRGTGYDDSNALLRRETWEDLQAMQAEGIIGKIGVSNFSERHLSELLKYANVKPAVNQIEVHPYNTRQSLVDFCQRKGILVNAYSPLGGKGNEGQVTDRLLDDPLLGGIANNHGKTVAQTILRWHLQRGITPIPKATSKAHLRENINIFDFELGADEMAAISSLNRDQFAILDSDLLA